MSGTELQRGTPIGPWTLAERLYKVSGREVWRATGPDDDHAVVEIATGEGLAREVALLAGVDHPCAIRVAEDHSGETPPWLRLAWPEGRLARESVRAGRLTVAEVLAAARELAGLLAHLHARGVFGPDLRPATVLLTHAGPVLTSWASARQAGPSVAAGDEPPDLRDLAALGVLLHALLTGERGEPGEGLDPGEDFSDAVRALVRGLTGPAGDRPRTAREVSYELRGLLNDPEALRDPPASKPRYTPRRAMMRGPTRLGPPPPPTLYGQPVTPMALVFAASAAVAMTAVAVGAAYVLYALISG